MNQIISLFALLMIVSALACTIGCRPSRAKPAGIESKRNASEPDTIKTRHILIPFLRAMPRVSTSPVPDKLLYKVADNQSAGLALAQQALSRAEAGEDFQELIQEYSVDGSGIIQISNHGVPKPNEAEDGVQIVVRRELARGYTDVAFQLDVGQFGIARFDNERNQLGFFVINRVE